MTDEDLIRNYETCKKLALTRESQTNLLILKEKFKDVINSPRSFEKINDLESLLKILEKRGELSETDIHLLEYVYSVLGINTKILENHNKLIERKCTSHRGESFENLAPSERASAQDKTSRYNRLLSEHVQNERPHGHATPRLSERGRKSTRKRSAPSSANPPEPASPDLEAILPVSILTVFSKTVNKVCTGLFCFLFYICFIVYLTIKTGLKYVIKSKQLWTTGFLLFLEVFELMANLISLTSVILKLVRTVIVRILNATQEKNNIRVIVSAQRYNRNRRHNTSKSRNSIKGLERNLFQSLNDWSFYIVLVPMLFLWLMKPRAVELQGEEVY